MAKTAQEVLKELKGGTYHPVYFFHGNEEYYIDLLTNYIEQNALDETAKGFNQVVLYGKDTEIRDILTQAKRFPMMSERQTVIVKEAQDIKDLNKEEAQTLLEDYIKNPLTSTILVFSHKHKTLDKRKKLSKSLDKLTVMVDSKKIYDNQVPEWIRSFVEERGHNIEEKAIYVLAEYIGSNLQRLSNEISKVLINFTEPSLITPQLIEKYVGVNKDYNSFELQRALALRDILKTNRIVQYFGENPKANPILPIIAILYSFFSKLLLIHQETDKSKKNIASKLGVNPYFVNEYMTASSHYPLAKVIRNIGYLHEADLGLKGVTTTGISEGKLLKELVFKLMH